MEIDKVIDQRDRIPNNTVENIRILFLKPETAVAMGIGNLFNSKDVYPTYPVAVGINMDGQVVKAMLISVDESRFNNDDLYRLRITESALVKFKD